MTYRFPLNGRLIPVDAVLTGPKGPVDVRLALDTGASRTQIIPEVLRKCGYDLSDSSRRIRVNTAGGTVERFTIGLMEMNALGVVHRSFPCVVGDIPRRSSIHGLLGIDHFEHRKLLIDFHRGRIVVGGRMALLW